MSEYFIRIKNQSGQVQNYLLFNDPPERGDLGTAYSNVWQRSNGVFSPNGSASFTIGESIFAVAGTTVTHKEIGLKLQITTDDNTSVTLATPSKAGTEANMEVIEGGAGFLLPNGKTDLAGSFAIKTGKYPSEKHADVWCGMGKYDPQGNIVPVITWRAWPSKTYAVQPIKKFWASIGSYQPGTVVNKTIFGDIVEVDFTDATKGNIATTYHQSDGSFTEPVYTHSKGFVLGELEEQIQAEVVIKPISGAC